MKVLTLWQPHASLCVLINPATGRPYKTIETRSRSTSYRGPLAIHAARRQVREDDFAFGQSDFDGLFHRHGMCVGALPLGAIVATATLVDVVPIVGPDDAVPPNYDRGLVSTPDVLVLFGPNDWWGDLPTAEHDVSDQRPYGDFTPDAGRFAWLLADVEPVDPPVPFRGGQGLTKTWEPA